ncbi:glutamate--tRNA ligase [Candidatus Saccharibacteria bacterium RIFCSPHIGHO2_12_FULL_42_8]|nr:MAG: glutamate--tRNA ligase [Candidatus Saccharibacteria bacterium RIFCSPHIGHO2_12_FULL_42_8]
MEKHIRTRFAPSPTGFLHVGGIRTALFAWLVAKQSDGKFILRLEDTDKAREVEGSAEHLIESLKSLGINYDEGPDVGGQFAPYKQSERLDIYKKWAQKLIDSGRAYADPYSREELQKFREKAQAEKKPFLYRNHRPNPPAGGPPNWDGSQPLRFKSDPKPYQWHDEVMGDLSTGPEVIDDFVLIKSDGFPTYNFAHIVDDEQMQISHVIRGQEFISSQPNYLNLYEALSLEAPIFATMPHIMATQGNKKLSKRDGAKDILDYLHDGYLPEALVSFIATLGWNDGTEQEIFTVSELIEKFSLARVQKSGAHFDEKRLEWVNGQFIRQLSTHELYEKVGNYWPDSAKGADEDYKMQILKLSQDRLKTLADLRQFGYFFTDPEQNMELIEGNKQLSKLSPERRSELIQQAKSALENSEFTPEAIQQTLNQLLEITGEKPGILFSLIRIHTTWAPFSPQLNETLALLGRDTTVSRLSKTS